MSSSSTPALRVAVIGGGISGLAAAHRLTELNPAVELSIIEQSQQWGGILQTNQSEGYLLEQSADMFSSRDSSMLDLCKRIGFQDELISTNEQHRRAFVVRRGKLYPVPRGWSLLSPTSLSNVWKSPLLSLRGRWRVSREPHQPVGPAGQDESLASFASRRLGREAYENIVQPLVGGIFTADPEKLSMAATLPQFLAMEQQHGSLVRGGREFSKEQGYDTGSGARYDQFLAPRQGFSSFVEALVNQLPSSSLQDNTRVESLERLEDGSWKLDLSRQGQSEQLVVERLIVATPASQTALLLSQLDAELAADLNEITASSVAIVTLGVKRSQFNHPLDGFGFVVPLVEKRPIIATSFSSIKFAGRAPEGEVLLRTFVGGACQPELLQQSDQQLTELTMDQLGELIGLTGTPRLATCTRWNNKMPQYHLGHVERVERIEQCLAALPGIELAGNAYRGVGLPACVQSGEQAAERLLDDPPAC